MHPTAAFHFPRPQLAARDVHTEQSNHLELCLIGLWPRAEELERATRARQVATWHRVLDALEHIQIGIDIGAACGRHGLHDAIATCQALAAARLRAVPRH